MTINDPSPSTGPKPPPTVIRGPEDADNYRVKVGRYGDRWYRDPLPSDDVAPAAADDESYPSVSTIKKASGSDWSYTTMKRIAQAESLEAIASTSFYERYEQLKVINKLGLTAAMRRGTNVHTWAECRAYGVPPTLTARDEGANYFGTVDRIFDELQPELRAAEFVCIHRHLNGYGYGGTSDGLFRIDGKLYKVDWKSRGEDSDHGCYPEEAAQLGAYAGCEYIILADDDDRNPHGARRRLMPELAGGLIVSIKPDSYEVYPVDLDNAFDHFAAMHYWWVARRSERKATGSKWAPRRSTSLTEDLIESRRQVLRDRRRNLTPAKQSEFDDGLVHIDKTDLDAIEALLDEVENPPSVLDMAAARMARDAEREADRRLSLEGGEADDVDVKLFKLRWNEMTDEAKRWVGDVVKQADEAGLDFRLSTVNSQRRVDIYCALTEWSQTAFFDPDEDEPFRAAIYTTLNVITKGDDTLGVLVGQLSTAEAALFRSLVAQIEAGRMTYTVDPDPDKAPLWEQSTPTSTSTESQSS